MPRIIPDLEAEQTASRYYGPDGRQITYQEFLVLRDHGHNPYAKPIESEPEADERYRAETDAIAKGAGRERRERIAVAALQGLLASNPSTWSATKHQDVAVFAVEMADALIAELDK